MKNTMRFLLVCIILALSMTSCQPKPDLSLLRVDEGTAPTAVRNFVNEQSRINGVNLYSDGVHGDYLFLNARNVILGEKASFFSSVNCEIVEETLYIYIIEDQTDDPSKEINNMAIYKINSAVEYDSIRVIKNGCEVPFDAVGA